MLPPIKIFVTEQKRTMKNNLFYPLIIIKLYLSYSGEYISKKINCKLFSKNIPIFTLIVKSCSFNIKLNITSERI